MHKQILTYLREKTAINEMDDNEYRIVRACLMVLLIMRNVPRWQEIASFEKVWLDNYVKDTQLNIYGVECCGPNL